MENTISEYNLFDTGRVRLQCHYGRVYLSKDGKVYRGIFKAFEGEIKKLLSSGLIDELTSKGLFPATRITNHRLTDYELIIEHERVPLRNTFEKWSFDMIKMSALTTLEVASIASKYGYELRDAHPYNIMFYYGNPMFIDLDSFVERKNEKWSAYREFVDCHVRLLQLLALQNNFEFQSSIKSMAFYIPHKIYNALIEEPERIEYHSNLTFNELKKFIKRINLHEIDSMWKDYHTNFDTNLNTNYRLKTIINLLNKYRPATIVDIACNAGEFSKSIIENCNFIQHIIGIDKDHSSINRLIRTVRGAPITVLYDDLNNDYPEKLSDKPIADLVMALAITHHLILSANLDINYVLEKIGSFTNKYMLIEFMPLGLYSSELKENKNPPDWYTESWFEEKLTRTFKVLFKEQVHLNRILFFLEKVT